LKTKAAKLHFAGEDKMKAIGIAILAAGILAGSTGALAAGRENVALKINTAGVNFGDVESVASFRRDLSRQIQAACNPGDRLNADLSPDFACRNQMAASVEPMIQQLVLKASDRRFAGMN